MLCIDNPYRDAGWNLAAEEYLLKNIPEDIFMMWQSEPCVIIGRHQDPEMESNAEVIRIHQIPIWRRISGGGAVYLDPGTINLTFIESVTNPDYRSYTDRIAGFLGACGIRVQADHRYGLYINGLKISGSAQYLYKNKALFHATLLYSTNLSLLEASLKPDDPISGKNSKEPSWRSVKSVKSPVTNIREYLPEPIAINDFKAQIINYFQGDIENNQRYILGGEDIAAITRLKQQKYVNI